MGHGSSFQSIVLVPSFTMAEKLLLESIRNFPSVADNSTSDVEEVLRSSNWLSIGKTPPLEFSALVLTILISAVFNAIALPFRKAPLWWIWDSELFPAIDLPLYRSPSLFTLIKLGNKGLWAQIVTSFLWRSLLPLSMAVAMDIPQEVNTAMAATNLCLILARWLMISTPNNTTTNLSKSTPPSLVSPTWLKLSSYTIPSNHFVIGSSTKNTHNMIKQTMFNMLVNSLSTVFNLENKVKSAIHNDIEAHYNSRSVGANTMRFAPQLTSGETSSLHCTRWHHSECHLLRLPSWCHQYHLGIVRCDSRQQSHRWQTQGCSPILFAAD